MTVNLKNFREQYEAKLASKKWHLEGGSVRTIGNWRDSTIKSKQIQTMELEANKRFYKENKFDKWFKKDRNVEMENETNYPSDPSALSLHCLLYTSPSPRD